MADPYEGTGKADKSDNTEFKEGAKTKIKISKGKKTIGQGSDRKSVDTLEINFEGTVKGRQKSMFGPKTLAPESHDKPIVFTFKKTPEHGTDLGAVPWEGNTTGPYLHVECPKDGTDPYVGHIYIFRCEPKIAIDKETQDAIRKWLGDNFPAAKKAMDDGAK
ncbi:MAG: hypothetical protein KGM42_06240 [Hyphomicrobiales bacterium]|nr:hypothetical protein [Hyphomicrobiales bacterium]